MYSITVSGERDACTFKSRYDKEREISQSGRTRNVRNVNGARGETGEGDGGRGGGYAYTLEARKIGVFCRQVAFISRATHYSVAL